MDQPISTDLTGLPTDEATLLEALRREAAYDMEWNKRLHRVAFCCIAATVCIFIGVMWAIGKSVALQRLLHLCQMIIYAIFMIWMVIIGRRKGRRQHVRVRLINKLAEDKRAIGYLLSFASDASMDEVAPLAGKILKQLLPHLRAEEATSLTSDQYMALLKLLKHNDKELVVIVLKALEQIGDERALVPVERLAAQTKYPKVQQAAFECLPYLQTRVQEKERALTLLRPSDTPSTPETLLRPTSAATDIAQEQLLRPLE